MNSLAAFLDTKDACIEHDNKVVQLLFYDLLGVGSVAHVYISPHIVK